MSVTPISDSYVRVETTGYEMVPYHIAQELERKVAGLEAAARFWQDKCGNECEARNAIQATLDALMLEFCPQEMTQEQRDRWEQSQKPAETVQYYYRDDKCLAYKADDNDCICWHDEGTGPHQSEKHNDIATTFAWRVKPEGANMSKDVVVCTDSDPFTYPTTTEKIAEMAKKLGIQKAEIESLRARNDKLAIELNNERILRYAAEGERSDIRNLAIYAETARCAQVARDFAFSPANGRAIAALIMEGRTR